MTSTRHRAELTVADPTLNALAFAGELLTFAGERLFFGPAPHPGVLPGGRVLEPLVVVCDPTGEVIG